MGPLFQLPWTKGFPASGKVELADQTVDPDIHRKSVPSAISIEKHAPGNLGSHPGELFELLGG
jgi:hypothetical protein